MSQIFKLVNGEDIIANVVSENESCVTVSCPMKFLMNDRKDSDGRYVESISLTRWLQPMSEDEVFEIKKQFVGLRCSSSVGMDQFYESSVNKVYDSITEETYADEDEYLDNLMEQMGILEDDSGTVH